MSNMMSQEEIEAMMEGISNPSESGDGVTDEAATGVSMQQEAQTLTPEEMDILGEIGNMCMGRAATTMYTLLGRRVNITTPQVEVYTSEEILQDYHAPYIVVEVAYIEGVEGNNLLLLKQDDAAMITDLLMGGDGRVEPGTELGELHLSAMSEVMNQMVGSSATTLAELLHRSVNISTPRATVVRFEQENPGFELSDHEKYIKIGFHMEIEDLLDSQIMQIMPFSFGSVLVNLVMATMMGETIEAAPESVAPPAASPAAATPVAATPVAAAPVAPPVATSTVAPPAPQGYAQQEYAQPQYAQPQYAQPQYAPPQYAPPPHEPVDVRAVQYQAFDQPVQMGGFSEGINMLIDVPLQVSVELGKSKKSIQDILEFNTGTIVVLDKIAGDPVDVLVNGKLIARGEVVVIDENYGVRITDIVAQARRIPPM